MMHVLLDCRMATWSGVGRYATGLARALATHDDVRLTQVCAPEETPPVAPGSCADVVEAGAHPFGVRGALELGRIARSVAPDVIHCTHFPSPVGPHAPLVITLHDLTPLVVPEVMPSPLKRSIYRRWNSRAARLADRLITPSQSTARDVARLFPAAADKLVTVPEAADDLSSSPARALSQHLSDLTRTPYVLSMGNTKPHKDLPTLLRAFARLAPAMPDLRLLLVGTEPRGYLQAGMRDIPPEIRSRVTFTGPVDDDGLRALYAGASVFVFPSKYEGFGLPVLEAMALGAPVVCTDAASLPEVAGGAARLFPAGDAVALSETLEEILDDPALRDRLIEAGRGHASSFSWERTATATIATYAEAIDGFRRHVRGRREKRGGGAP